MNKIGMYMVLVFFLAILLDNSSATDYRAIHQENVGRLEYYEMHEAFTPAVIFQQGIIGNKEDGKGKTKTEPSFSDEVEPELLQVNPAAGLAEKKRMPVFKITQQELNQIYEQNSSRIAYFTFDDGPSEEVTNRILDILKEEQVKATFFVVGSNARKHPQIIKRMYEEGHMLANHTYTHEYNNVYSSADKLIDELDRTEALIQEILGFDYPLKLMRFPGGSFGKRSAFKSAVNERGYLYIDWNSLNGDTEGLEMTEERLLERFASTSANKAPLIILLHDTDSKSINVDVLPEMIRQLREKGYTFDTLMPVVGKTDKKRAGQ